MVKDLLFPDICDVFERREYLKDDGSIGFCKEKVLSSAPCRVSYIKAGDGRNIKLFLNSERVVKPNSEILVSRKGENGEFQTLYKNSSTASIYSGGYSERQEIILEKFTGDEYD